MDDSFVNLGEYKAGCEGYFLKNKTGKFRPGADLVNWGPKANIEMGPYTFAHIYLNQPWVSFFVVMLAAAQWCPIVVSNVVDHKIAIYRWDTSLNIYIYI